MKDKLQYAIEKMKTQFEKAVAENDTSVVVEIKGKPYMKVAPRIALLTDVFGAEKRFLSTIEQNDDKKVAIKSEFQIKVQGAWETIGDGLAEEYRSKNHINANSALENCQTSAIGRAMSSAGMTGSEFSSAEEVVNAINDKPKIQDVEKEEKKQTKQKQKEESGTFYNLDDSILFTFEEVSEIFPYFLKWKEAEPDAPFGEILKKNMKVLESAKQSAMSGTNPNPKVFEEIKKLIARGKKS